MKITKFIDLGQEVEVEISAEDVAQSLAEDFAIANRETIGEKPLRFDLVRALNSMAVFLNALTDEQIALLEPKPRKLVREFLHRAALRFVDPKGD